MKLYTGSQLPTRRMILVVVHEAGLGGRLEVVEQAREDPADKLASEHPDGQPPVLLCDDGSRLSGAAAISEYLDGLHERPKLMPDKGEARLELLQLESSAYELLDTGFALSGELRRPASARWSETAERQWARLEHVLDELERLTNSVLVGPVTLGHIALACALDWIDSRLPKDWRCGHKALAAWLDRFRQRPSMRATAI